MPLNKKQQDYVDAYLKDPGANQADLARRAGYSRRSAKFQGSRLARNPKVLAEIERRKLEKLVHAQLDKIDTADLSDTHVLAGLMDIIERCRREGSAAHLNVAKSCWELVGKHLKMFTDRVELGADDALINALLEGRKRAGMLQPITIDAKPANELHGQNTDTPQ